jgi:hypothetical protein
MTPEICSVAGRRSGMVAVMSGDSFCHGWMGLGDPPGSRFRGDLAAGRIRVGWCVSEVRAAFVANLATVLGWSTL